MKLDIKNIRGESQGEREIAFTPVEENRGNQAVHDVVVAYMAAQRSGTACTKTRGEVSGSNKKPWRQKGTGRARAGSIRSPLWRGGGVVFGPRPRDFRKKVPTRVRQLAFRKALTERIKSGDVTVVSDLKIESPKTKAFIDILKNLNLTGSTLVVTQGVDANTALSCRNVPRVDIETSHVVNTYQLLRYDHLVFTQEAIQEVETRAGGVQS